LPIENNESLIMGPGFWGPFSMLTRSKRLQYKKQIIGNWCP